MTSAVEKWTSRLDWFPIILQFLDLKSVCGICKTWQRECFHRARDCYFQRLSKHLYGRKFICEKWTLYQARLKFFKCLNLLPKNVHRLSILSETIYSLSDVPYRNISISIVISHKQFSLEFDSIVKTLRNSEIVSAMIDWQTKEDFEKPIYLPAVCITCLYDLFLLLRCRTRGFISTSNYANCIVIDLQQGRPYGKRLNWKKGPVHCLTE